MMSTIESNDQDIVPSASDVQSDLTVTESESAPETPAEPVSEPQSPWSLNARSSD